MVELRVDEFINTAGLHHKFPEQTDSYQRSSTGTDNTAGEIQLLEWLYTILMDRLFVRLEKEH